MQSVKRPTAPIFAKQSCIIQFDAIGKEHWLLEQTRTELIHALIDRGYARHLLISHDRNHATHNVDNLGPLLYDNLSRFGVTIERYN